MAETSLKYLLYGEDKTASKAIKGVGDQAEGVASKLGGMVGRMGSLIGGEVGEIVDKVGSGLEAAGASHDKLGKRMLATGGIATAAGVAMTMMASSDVEAQNQLAAAVDATGKGYADFGDDVDALIEKQTAFGHTDGEVKGALASLTQAYGDPKEALDKMGLATDLAAAKHISLGDAATMVGKAHNGSAKIFKEFGVQVGQNADGTKDYEGGLDQLSGKLTGQAAAAQDSFSGKLREGKAVLDNQVSALGEKYGPALTAAGAAVSILGTLTQGTTVSIIAGKVAHLAASAATGVMTAAQWLLNAAMTANPIGIVIVALTALAAGLIWAYQNSDTFRAIVDGAFHAIAEAGTWMWNTILAPVMRSLLQSFSDAANGVANFLDALSHVPGFGWAKDAADKIRGAADAAHNLAAGINDIPSNKRVTVTVDVNKAVLGQVDGVIAGVAASAGRNASGTDNWRGGLTWVGEQGAELVSLPAGTQIYNHDQSMAMVAGQPAAAAGMGSGDLHLHAHVAGSVVTPRDLARDLRDEWLLLGSRGDPLPS